MSGPSGSPAEKTGIRPKRLDFRRNDRSNGHLEYDLRLIAFLQDGFFEHGMVDQIWREVVGRGPLIATAIHDGHDVRDEVKAHLALSEPDRLREEDPFSGRWTEVAPTRIVGLRSRFEVDLNRPRPKAVYRTPDDAWGLKVWNTELPEDVARQSLAEYDAFYEAVRALLSGVAQRHGRFVVLDLHSYNHRRSGPTGPAADGVTHPQVNVGTGTMDRARWAPVVDRFIADLRQFDFPGGRLDVRENVKFFGGNFPRWIHTMFSQTGCALAIEFKKFFMDEWSGEPDGNMLESITKALESTVPGVLEALQNL